MKQSQPTQLTARFEAAFRYAAAAHAGQTRKGTPRPYIGHLLSVTALVLEYGGDEEQAIAALLHDAVEAAGGRRRLADIRRRFGRRVARIVEGCSDSFAENPAERPPWKARKRDYIARIPGEPAEVKLVSAADKLSNVRELVSDLRSDGPATFARFQGGRDGTLWYYRELARAFRRGGQSPALARLLDEYDRAVAELRRLAARTVRRRRRRAG
jgi:(p)ppGpp synthase/HD superfamily hydrolase